MFSPIDLLRQQHDQLLRQSLGTTQQQPLPTEPQIPKLTPDDENSLLDNIWSTGGSALQWLGNELDYLGRPVRGLLGGHPEELASLIPFSDTLGITSKQNEVSPRGLLENWGVLDKQPEGAGFLDDIPGNVAAMATGIATDPLSWMGFGLAKHGAGALSQGGKVARALGALPDWKTGLELGEGAASKIGHLAEGASGPTATAMQQTLGDALKAKGIPEDVAASVASAQGYKLPDILDQKLAGLVGVGPPIFGADNLMTLGHGPMAQGIANATTRARLALRYSAPGRFAAQLLDVPSKQMETTGGQIAAREATEATEASNAGQQFRAATRLGDWQDLGLTPREGLSPEEAQRAVYEKSYPLTEQEAAAARAARGGDDALNPTLAENRSYERAAQYAFPGATPDQLSKAVELARNFAGEMGGNLDQLNSAGLPRALGDETVPYVGRQAMPPPGAKPGAQFANEALQTTGVPGRIDELGDMPATAKAPGGTASLNQMAGDSRIVGPTANEEGVPLARVVSNPKGEMIDSAGLGALPPEVQKTALDAFNAKGIVGMSEAVNAARQAGLAAPEAIDAATKAGAFRPLTRTLPAKAQEIIWQDFKGYTKPEIDSGMSDLAKYSGLPDSQIQADMEKQFGKEDAESAFERYNGFKTTRNQVVALQERAAQNRLPVFPNDPETDSVRLQMKNVENAEAGKAVARHIGRVAQPIIGAEGDRGVPILQNLEDSKLHGHEPIKTVAEQLAKRGLLTDEDAAILQHGPVEVPEKPILKSGRVLGPPEEITAETAGQTGHAVQESLDAHEAAKAHNAAYDEAKNRLNGLRVPFSNASDNSRVMAFMNKGPDALSAGRGWITSATQLFKAWNIGPWPANKIRDLTTGLWQQFAGGWHYGDNPLNPANWSSPLSHMASLLRGEDADLGKYIPMFKGMEPAEASKLVRRMMYATDLMGGPETAALEASNAAPKAFKSISSQLPGAEPFQGILPTLKSAFPSTLAEASPLGIRGVGGRTETTNAFVKAGMDLSNQAWSVPKGAIFLSALSKGHPMEQAAAIAKAAMVDFDRLTPFERKLLRPMLPFATWTRHMVPWMVSELAHNPGGTTAQAVRAVGGAGQTGFTPKQLEGQTNIPLTGEDATGNKKFLSGFDLPFEVLDDLFHPGRNAQETVRNTLAGWAGYTNPLIKVPVELATNRQLYSGRELSDLKGRLGYLGKDILGTDKPLPVPPLVEELLMNSPAARLLSTAGKIADPRKSIGEKALNTLTGVHTTDVDMPQARDVAAREAAQELLQGTPGVRQYTDLSVRKEDLGNLSPEQLKMYALYRGIAARRQAEAKAKKREEALTSAAQ